MTLSPALWTLFPIKVSPLSLSLSLPLQLSLSTCTAPSPPLSRSLSLSTRCLQLMYGNEREKSVRDQRRLCGAHALIRRLDLSAGPAVWPRGRERGGRVSIGIARDSTKHKHTRLFWPGPAVPCMPKKTPSVLQRGISTPALRTHSQPELPSLLGGPSAQDCWCGRGGVVGVNGMGKNLVGAGPLEA